MCRLLALRSCGAMALGRCAAFLYLLGYAAHFRTEAYTVQRTQQVENGPVKTDEGMYRREKMSTYRDGQECPIYRNEALHAVLDRVCLMCHEMFSHEQPDLRAECRSNCFNNEKFRSCLAMFAPPRKNSRRDAEFDLWNI
uniref:Uncharacterized protein n=1 Tax=Steinernema glaseri TaxID=37863 RepID=A0A1I7ZR84_9BILA